MSQKATTNLYTLNVYKLVQRASTTYQTKADGMYFSVMTGELCNIIVLLSESVKCHALEHIWNLISFHFDRVFQPPGLFKISAISDI